MGLEEFHRRADSMEKQDDSRFAYRLEAECQKKKLHQQRGQKQDVVPGKGSVLRPEVPRDQFQREQRSAKDAGPSGFQNKEQKLPNESSRPVPGNMPFQMQTHLMKARLLRSDG